VLKNNLVAIFDLDGTLVDSVLQIGTLLNESRIAFGYVPLAQSFYEDSVGLPLDALLADLAISETEKRDLVSSFRVNLTEDIRRGHNPLFNGVREDLNYLSSKNVNLAIATSKPTQIARDVYKNSELI
jgi:phosphoglycolate phosphatase